MGVCGGFRIYYINTYKYTYIHIYIYRECKELGRSELYGYCVRVQVTEKRAAHVLAVHCLDNETCMLWRVSTWCSRTSRG